MFLLRTVLSIVLHMSTWKDSFQGVAIGDPSALWNDGLVPYTIADGEFNSEELGFIQKVFEHLHNHTCLQFVNRTNQDDYVLIVRSYTCASYVGRKGGMQLVTLESHCLQENAMGDILHQFMHIIGFYHEHSRFDRDEYIEVLWHNIDNRTESFVRKNFVKYALDVSRNLQTEYDYDSIMHFGSTAFAFPGKHTIIPKKSQS